MEDQFNQEAALVAPQNGQEIEGQYIVVLKAENSSLGTSSSQGLHVSQVNAARIRTNAIERSGINAEAISQIYEGAVNGFAAHLNKEQLAALLKNPNIAYIEQDRVIALVPPGRNNGINDLADISERGKVAKAKPTPTPSEPVPAPVEPAPTEPAPTEPAPTEPAPTEPVLVPAEPAPAFAKITPLAGETIPWNIERVGYGDGTGKTVWVIDSGIDTDHPDLNIDLTRSASFIYGNPSIEDGFGHGTSVAGVIAAKNNGSGMIGIAANATIIALRVFDDAGAGTVSRAITAVNHIINNAKPGDVVNMSLGSGISSTLDNAVLTAAGKGVLFSIAAGNSGVDCAGSSPARVNGTGVYTISAMDNYNRLWASSNYGAGVDFTAPGVNVTATNKNGGISSGMNGTSFSAPHVAGILLLRGEVFTQGFVTGDKDATPDPIASLN
ncbi:hypothetical protein GCM10028895_11130 [Pontibacter rugosus]